MLRKFKHVAVVTALLAASSSAVTIEKQPQARTEIDLNQIDIEDMVDTNNLELREAAEVEQSYGDAPKTVETMLESLKDITFSHSKWEFLRAVQEFGQISGVTEILVNYVTDKPSKQERAVIDQLKNVTDVMKNNQKRFVEVYLQKMHKNTLYLSKDKDLVLLDKMVASQLARGNMYRDNSIVFNCGDNAHLCKTAYKNWVQSMQKRVTKLMKDGKVNAYGKHDDLGYNRDNMYYAWWYLSSQLQKFSTGIIFADAGARAWDNRQEDPNPKSPIPSVTFKQQEFADFVSKLEEDNWNWMWDQYNLLVKYSKTSETAMGYGDKKRENQKLKLLKGLHLGNGKLTNNIDGMIWGQWQKGWYSDVEVDCTKSLAQPNGMCECPHNTWMRGQAFPDNKANRYLNGWTKNYCTHITSYVHKNCEVIDFKGTNAWTNCPMNKYVVGIGRGADKLGAMDKAKLKCCELEHNFYYSNSFRLPERYYSADKKSLGFRTSDTLQFLTVDNVDKKGGAFANNGTHEPATWLQIVQTKEEFGFGLLKLLTITGKYLTCTKTSPTLLTNGTDEFKSRFVIVKRGHDTVLYHQNTQKHVTLNAKSGRFECQQTSPDKAAHFQGPKVPFPDINEHLYYPELFRTAYTSDKYKKLDKVSGGFQPSAVSEWFVFYNKENNACLRGGNDGSLKGIKGNQPGGLEKFKLERYERKGHVVWGIKSAAGKYLVCEVDGTAYANRGQALALEEMKLFQVDTGKLVIYNAHLGRYLRIAGPDAKDPRFMTVKCDTENPKEATVWTTPDAK